MFKNLRKQIIAGLVFGVMAVAGIAITMAFQEPISGPSGFSEPDNIYDKGDWAAYGRGWIASSSGSASTALTKAACDATSTWEWFEDGNGDGDTTDSEDGICVKVTTVTSASWNGYDWGTDYDNSYIAAYECENSYPDGSVKAGTYSGIDSSGNTDSTWNDGDCALCQTDCYDGRKDLPDQGSYTNSATGTTGYYGPLTPEILKSWKGTRLPTHNDFYGYCGYKDGGSDYETGCSSTVGYGNNGQMMGRTDECMDLSDTSYEWLSGQHSYTNARIAGDNACSYVYSNIVYNSYRFRAVFRP